MYIAQNTETLMNHDLIIQNDHFKFRKGDKLVVCLFVFTFLKIYLKYFLNNCFKNIISSEYTIINSSDISK